MTVVEQAADVLQKAKKVVFFTGAGISADSGIPTYREKLSGVWAGLDPRDLETARPSGKILPWYGDGIYGAVSESLRPSQMPHILRYHAWLTHSAKFL